MLRWYHRRSFEFKFAVKTVWFELLLLFLLNSCITTNYYTARTLKQGQNAVTVGMDNLLIISEDGEKVSKKVTFTPSLGLSRGLPLRLEAGFRYYFPYLFEASLRHQLNPPSFTWFDVSLNVHGGLILSDQLKHVSRPYWKYGLTISKEMWRVEPYFSFYLNKNFMIERLNDSLSDYQIFTFGMAIPIFKKDRIYPEINYLKNQFGAENYFTFGVGIRAFWGN